MGFVLVYVMAACCDTVFPVSRPAVRGLSGHKSPLPSMKRKTRVFQRKSAGWEVRKNKLMAEKMFIK